MIKSRIVAASIIDFSIPAERVFYMRTCEFQMTIRKDLTARSTSIYGFTSLIYSDTYFFKWV